MMTEQQIKWAEGHDWCIGRISNSLSMINPIDCGVAVKEVTRHPDGTVTEAYHTFDDYRALRRWAGY